MRVPAGSASGVFGATGRWSPCSRPVLKGSSTSISVESFRRKLQRNPSLILACRFKGAVRCVLGVSNVIGSAVFAKMQNGASYASRSTRTSFAPLRRCRDTPIDGSGCTGGASMPGSVATFSWNATICEGLKPCRCAYR